MNIGIIFAGKPIWQAIQTYFKYPVLMFTFTSISTLFTFFIHTYPIIQFQTTYVLGALYLCFILFNAMISTGFTASIIDISNNKRIDLFQFFLYCKNAFRKSLTIVYAVLIIGGIALLALGTLSVLSYYIVISLEIVDPASHQLFLISLLSITLIPSLWIITRLLLFPFYIINDNHRAFQSLKSSYKATSPHQRTLIITMLLLIAIGYCLALLLPIKPQLITLFYQNNCTAISILTWNYIYTKLKI